ncbi:MAG: adenosine deaminase [Paenibacillaceae bacterium]|jgi:adenosine deaminase|nr:adenosine deaminase [Paenibacillaceae bacterium]
MKQQFMEALMQDSLSGVTHIPKSDLHSHAGRGGNIRYVAQWAKATIDPPPERFASLGGMGDWFAAHVKCHCPGLDGYLIRVQASFVQAAEDGIGVFALNFGLDEIRALGGVEPFVQTISGLHSRFAPETVFLPELALDRGCDPDGVKDFFEEALACGWFCSVDICGNELAQPAGRFKSLYRLARSYGMVLRAHTGEFGTADDVLEAVEELGLDEVHHGIAAAQSSFVMRRLADEGIRLHVCPTSNIMLGRAESYAGHPIRQLYDAGVPVTINTDDLLIFDQTVSQEYLNLYRSGLMTAEELNAIREEGLKV